ncbi:MAG TPA: DNA topoisomerase, partial [Longimicrobium sp.]|nr:DNA topoisomerase [Longimicrobium sp.]
EQFEVVRRVLGDPKVTEVVCATDAGREGELIFRYVYEAAGCRKPVRRLWISSLTEGAIQEGFEKLRDGRVFDPLADAARGRSQADWLVGMNLSRHYGLAFDEPLSVGRVQTPTLAMVVERELAIRNFVPQDYLEVVATFSPRPGVSYDGTWFKRPAPGEKPPEQPRRLPKDGPEAEAIVARAKRGQAAILSVESETKRMLAPLLYDLTELQRHANRLFGFSAQRTLDAAQALYERHKLISYPRTDSRHLSQAIAGTLPQVVRAIEGQYQGLLAPGTGTRPLSRRFVDDDKVSDHHAIIPTDKSAEGKVLGGDERRIYDLICRRLLQAWHGDYVWAATTVITEIRQADGPEVDAFHSSGSAVKEPGWKVLDLGGGKKPPKARGEAKKDDEPQDGDDEQDLPSGLREGQPQQVLDAKAVPKKTRPPPRLTEGALLTAMETAGKALDEKELSEAMRESGLGTPATRAATIETLLARGYLVRNGKTLEATEKGIRLIEVVDPDVKSPVMTGQWEARLQRIERGSGDLPSFMADIEAYVRDVVGRLPPQVPPRPAPFPPRSGVGLGAAQASPGPASRGGKALGGRATLSPARVPPPSAAAPSSSYGQLSLLPNSFSRAPSPA